jgi:hypothetical protein
VRVLKSRAFAGSSLPIALASFFLLLSPSHGATITIVNADSSGEGFNDPTPRAPVAGNAGTTLGQQRLNAFAAAAAYWANRLVSPVPIVVRAQMNPLACTPSSGTLGSAGPTGFSANFSVNARPQTWYPFALANAIKGSDVAPADPDISAQFNSLIAGNPGCLGSFDWSYVVGAASPVNTYPFYETVLHELSHGLGFLTAVDKATGARLQGFDDIFMTFLEDHSTGTQWPAMSDGSRAASAVDTSDLHWTGPIVVAAAGPLASGRHASGHVQMYAPAILSGGSSVSHWDTALVPDEMMEPFATPTSVDIVTTALLRDIGWTTQQSGPCVEDATTACILNGRFRVKVRFRNGFDNNPVDFDANHKKVTGFANPNFETAFFFFNSPDNLEILVKMLDQGNVNAQGQPTIAVLFGSATPLRIELTITDTLKGTIKTYSNNVYAQQGATDFTAFVK